MFLWNILLDYAPLHFSISSFTALFQNSKFTLIYAIPNGFLRSLAEVTNITNTSLSFTSLPLQQFYKLSVSCIFQNGSVHLPFFPISQDCRFIYNWFNVVDNKAEPFYLTNHYWMIWVERNQIISLCKS